MSGLLEKLSERPVVGDLPLRKVLCSQECTTCSEALSVLAPQRVLDAHCEAVAAGAGVIRTNTFAANALHLSNWDLQDRANEINWSAVQIARSAVKGTGAIVAGSIGPCQGTGRNSDREASEDRLRNQIGALLDGGVDCLVFEGFRDIEMLSRALHIKQELHHLPAVCCLEIEAPLATSAFVRLVREGAEVVGRSLTAGREIFGEPEEDMNLGDAFLVGEISASLPPTNENPSDSTNRASTPSFAHACLQLSQKNVRLFFGGSGVTLRNLSEASQALSHAGEVDAWTLPKAMKLK